MRNRWFIDHSFPPATYSGPLSAQMDRLRTAFGLADGQGLSLSRDLTAKGHRLDISNATTQYSLRGLHTQS